MKKIFLICCVFLFGHLQADTTFAMPENPIMVMETNYGTMEILLLPHIAPKASENFIRLAEKGSYENVPFHRIIPNFIIQGGDYTKQNGSGGKSIWNRPFEDEFSDQLLFDAPGRVGMSNAGPNSNGSQFFITTAATPWFNNRHTLFGVVIEGLDTMRTIEALGSPSGKVRTSKGWWWDPVYVEPPVILNLYLKS